MPYKDPNAKKQWRRRNAKAIAAYTEKWKAENPDRVDAHKAAERIKNRTVGATLRGMGQGKQDYSRAHRAKYRAMAIERLGGHCEACGFSDARALEFDHRSPLLRKTNGLRRGDSLETARAILSSASPFAEFALLCANCHRIKTREGGEWTRPAELVARPVEPDAQLPLGNGSFRPH